jgi:hypothetical protein
VPADCTVEPQAVSPASVSATTGMTSFVRAMGESYAVLPL